VSQLLPDLPNVAPDLFQPPHNARFAQVATSTHAPRFLLLYGSLRERSFSKLLTLEAQRLLMAMGAETRVFDPHGLPLPDAAPPTHPKVKELREWAEWSEGMVWCSPERHGAMTGIMKAQIDWIQSSVAKAFLEFDDAGRMKPSSFYERVVDVMEELVKYTLLTRDVAPYLVDRYSERRESAEELSKRVNLR
jgi:arsenic resistance protein ArsH